jgi:hypothetical protein
MKILIMENPVVLPMIRNFLNEIDRTHGGCSDLIICKNMPEAEICLKDANLAIIDLDDGGNKLALEAVTRYKIPVIATSALLGEGALHDTTSFCYMAKPMVKNGFEHFRLAILQFQKLIEKKVSVTWRTEHFLEELDAGSDTCRLN